GDAEGSAAAGAAGRGASSCHRRPRPRAVIATGRIRGGARQRGGPAPENSRRAKVAGRKPAAGPRGLGAEGGGRAAPRAWLVGVPARAAAGSVRPMASVGTARTSALSTSRPTVPMAAPRVSEPPLAKYADRTSPSRNGLTAAETATITSSWEYRRSGRGW